MKTNWLKGNHNEKKNKLKKMFKRILFYISGLLCIFVVVYLLSSYQHTFVSKIFQSTEDENMHINGTSHEIAVDVFLNTAARARVLRGMQL